MLDISESTSKVFTGSILKKLDVLPENLNGI